MVQHPYRELPEFTRWSKAIAQVPCDRVDPVVNFPFRVKQTDRVATAGSCFAQHIARHLKSNGFNYFVTEEGHSLLGICPGLLELYNYGTFSARFGNIYTSRQLLQTFKRSFGAFEPQEPVWTEASGRFIDPFRPAIQPNGFATMAELERDRLQHLDNIKRMFLELDIFVFTLGLTEFWYCVSDGAALPVCPGVSGGVFNEALYAFGNLTVTDVVADMEEFFLLLREVNPSAKIILTVSPVPLAATAEVNHVLVSTTYSKSVLRVAAETLSRANNHVAYFPSYEIITGNFSRGQYYSDNLRDVTELGVSHVMRLFLQHAAEATGEGGVEEPDVAGGSPGKFYAKMQEVMNTVCEEALIEASLEVEAATNQVESCK